MTGYTRQQLAYLNAMGIQAWMPRDAVDVDGQRADPGGVAAATQPPAADVVKSATHSVTVANTDNAAIDVAPVPDATPVPAGNEQNARVDWQDVRHDDWRVLRARVQQCTACDLHKTRTQTVFGVGDQQADWLIVGEAPGAEEDRQGEPFVGRAGQLLNNMLLAIGLRREQVYIANILKCRPPNNRDPRPEEVVQCEYYLQRQVELLQPKIILAVGRIAAQNLLKTDIAIGRLRGKLHYYGSDTESRTPVVVTYHPAYLLRSPKEKRKAWQDLQFAVSVSQGSMPSI